MVAIAAVVATVAILLLLSPALKNKRPSFAAVAGAAVAVATFFHEKI